MNLKLNILIISAQNIILKKIKNQGGINYFFINKFLVRL